MARAGYFRNLGGGLTTYKTLVLNKADDNLNDDYYYKIVHETGFTIPSSGFARGNGQTMVVKLQSTGNYTIYFGNDIANLIQINVTVEDFDSTSIEVDLRLKLYLFNNGDLYSGLNGLNSTTYRMLSTIDSKTVLGKAATLSINSNINIAMALPPSEYIYASGCVFSTDMIDVSQFSYMKIIDTISSNIVGSQNVIYMGFTSNKKDIPTWTANKIALKTAGSHEKVIDISDVTNAYLCLGYWISNTAKASTISISEILLY